MHGGVTGQALECVGVGHELALLGVLALGQGFELRDLLGGLVEGHLELVGHQLGYGVHLAEWHAQDAPHIPDDGLGAQGAKGDDLAHGLLAILLHHVPDDLVTPGVGEVDVEVGHAHPLGVEEALEEQIVLHGVDAGDAQRVGHEAAGAGAAPRPHGDALPAGKADIVPDNEEVPAVSHLVDDAQLVVEPLLQGLIDAVVPTAHPLIGQMREVLDGSRELLRHREGGQLHLTELELEVALVGDGHGALDGPGQIFEELVHLRRGLHVQPGGVAHPGFVREVLTRLNADQGVVSRVVAGLEKVEVVGGHQGDPEFLGELDETLVDLLLFLNPVSLHLQVVVLAKDVQEISGRLLCCGEAIGAQQVGDLAADASGQAGKPIHVFSQKVFVEARIVVIPLQIPLGYQLHKVVPPRAVARQEDEVVGGVRQAAGGLAQVAAANGDVGFAADDGLDAGLGAGVVVGDGPEQVAVVGDGQGGHAVLARSARHSVDMTGPIQEAVLTVAVKVDELSRCHDTHPRKRRSLGTEVQTEKR